MSNPYRSTLIALLSLAIVVLGAFAIFAPPLTVCVSWDGRGGACFDWMGGAPTAIYSERINT